MTYEQKIVYLETAIVQSDVVKDKFGDIKDIDKIIEGANLIIKSIIEDLKRLQDLEK